MVDNNLSSIVLGHLYKKYYEEGFANPVDTNDVLKEAGISSNISDSVYATIDYLAQSGFIKDEKPMGEKLP